MVELNCDAFGDDKIACLAVKKIAADKNINRHHTAHAAKASSAILNDGILSPKDYMIFQ